MPCYYLPVFDMIFFIVGQKVSPNLGMALVPSNLLRSRVRCYKERKAVVLFYGFYNLYSVWP